MPTSAFHRTPIPKTRGSNPPDRTKKAVPNWVLLFYKKTLLKNLKRNARSLDGDGDKYIWWYLLIGRFGFTVVIDVFHQISRLTFHNTTNLSNRVSCDGLIMPYSL